jgi:hypothetical protein
VSVLGWVLVVLAAVLVCGGAFLVAGRVRRLDRLHVRTDAAWAALESALERRAAAALVVAEVLAAVPGAGDRARRVRAAAGAARTAGDDREAAENVLGRELAVLPRSALPEPVLEELVDAEQLLLLARRVHNDAVRDTRGLRSRRLVRLLHLAGTAPMPEYFEIADAEAPLPGAGVTAAAPVRRPVAPPA